MSSIKINIRQPEVYNEVAKATDYTGSKMLDSDKNARDRIFALDADLKELERFWEESALAVNENFKQMLLSGGIVKEVKPNGETVDLSTAIDVYTAEFETSASFDSVLTGSIESLIRSYFINSIISKWFKYTNKGESDEYSLQAQECLLGAERLLYSRKRPAVPTRTTPTKQ